MKTNTTYNFYYEAPEKIKKIIEEKKKQGYSFQAWEHTDNNTDEFHIISMQDYISYNAEGVELWRDTNPCPIEEYKKLCEKMKGKGGTPEHYWIEDWKIEVMRFASGYNHILSYGECKKVKKENIEKAVKLCEKINNIEKKPHQYSKPQTQIKEARRELAKL